MKKVLNFLRNTFVVLLVLLAVIMMTFTIISTTTNSTKNKSLFGFKAFIVLTDSMSATDFKAGDLVIVKETPVTDLKIGDIISYRSQDKAHLNEVVTHKIREINKKNGEIYFTTYGTTTGIDDKETIGRGNILGKYCFSLPKMGTVFQFLKTTPGYIVCILIPFLLLILIQAINSIRLFARYKKETLEEIEEERRKLEMERMEAKYIKEKLAETEEASNKMRQELEELKKSVGKKTAKKTSTNKAAAKKQKAPPEDTVKKSTTAKKQTTAKNKTASKKKDVKGSKKS